MKRCPTCIKSQTPCIDCFQQDWLKKEDQEDIQLVINREELKAWMNKRIQMLEVNIGNPRYLKISLDLIKSEIEKMV
jgi:hypothetical protein